MKMKIASNRLAMHCVIETESKALFVSRNKHGFLGPVIIVQLTTLGNSFNPEPSLVDLE